MEGRGGGAREIYFMSIIAEGVEGEGVSVRVSVRGTFTKSVGGWSTRCSLTTAVRPARWGGLWRRDEEADFPWLWLWWTKNAASPLRRHAHWMGGRQGCGCELQKDF